MLRISQQHMKVQEELKARLRKITSTEKNNVHSASEEDLVTSDLALPLRKKSQLILPLDFGQRVYVITEEDRKFLRKYAEKGEIERTIGSILNNRNLSPLRSSIKVFDFLLTFAFIFLFVIAMWISLGILILFIYNPIVFIFLIYIHIEVIAKSLFTYRGMFLESAKNKKLRNYLKQENLRYYNKKNLSWSLGHNGGWLQVDLIRK